MKPTVMIILLLLFTGSLYSQTDIVSWTGVQISAQNDDGVTLALKPIIRHNNDLSSYSNSSIDFSISKKLNNNLKVSYLFRHWWMQDDIRRVFWWFDLAHNHSFNSKLNFSNRVRWHIAMDKDIEDADFIRYYPEFKYSVAKGLNVFAGVEFWFDTDTERGIDRKRYQLGFDKKLGEKMALNFQYWLETTDTSEFSQKIHTLVTTLKFNF